MAFPTKPRTANQNGVVDPDEEGPLLGTNIDLFIADADPLTTTDPTDPDSDGDGFSDGEEDPNMNGPIDPGESNPNSGLEATNMPFQTPTPSPSEDVLHSSTEVTLGHPQVEMVFSLERRRLLVTHPQSTYCAG